MKRKHAFTIISEGLVFSKENTLVNPKENTAADKESSPNLVALQQELQKIQIKPKYIKINLKK